MRNLATTGIIIKKHNCGDYDQFVTIYSPTFGKIQAFTKGSRKIESSFTGHLEVLNICKFEIYKNANKFTITQCLTSISFKQIRNDLNKTVLALLLLEIFDKSTYSEENSQAVFELISKTLGLLNQTSHPHLCIEKFKIKLLNLLGVLPDISSCSFCHKRWLESDSILLDNDGHLTCKSCQKSDKTYKNINFNIIKVANFLKAKRIEDDTAIKLNPEQIQSLKKFSNTFLQHFLNHEIKSEQLAGELL